VIKKGDITDFLSIPYDASLELKSSIDFSDGIDAEGILVLIQKSEDEIKSGEFSFEASHNKENNYLSIILLKGGIKDLLSIDMNGRAGNLPDNGLISLKGKLNIPEASRLEPWLPFLEKIKLSGAVNTDKLLIKKDGDVTKVKSGFESENFLLDFGEDNKLHARKLSTDNMLEFIYKRDNEGSRYSLDLKDVRYKGFSYLDYESPDGLLRSLNFNYLEGIWDVKITSAGSSVINHSLSAMLSDYKLNLGISYANDVEISGDIKGVDGNYGAFNLETFFTNFKYGNNKIDFDSLEAGIETYGNVSIDSGSLVFPGQADGEFLLEIQDSNYLYTDPHINSEQIKGLFTIKASEDGSSLIEGKLFAEKAYLYGNEIDNLNLDYFSENNDYVIKNIVGNMSGGKLGGRLDFSTEGNKISYDASINLSGINNKKINIEKIKFDSKGVFSNGLFSDAKGILIFRNLYFGSGYTEAGFNGELDFTANPETISIESGFITNDDGNKFEFTGGLNDYSEEKRVFNLNAPEIPLEFVIDVFSGYLPDNTFILDVKGSVAVIFKALNYLTENEVWNGNVKLNKSTMSAFINNADVLVEDAEGSISIKEKTETDNQLGELLGNTLDIDRAVFKKYLELIKNKADIKTKDFLKIGKLRYGFFEANNIEANFEMDNEKMNLLYIKSYVYNGNVYINGLLNFGNENEKYNINMLFSELSLESISDSLPSMKGYITGLVDGLLWFSVGNGYTSIDGPFSFWTKDSKNEKMTIGRALLDKIGAKGRFFTGSSRRYDKGEIAGYTKDGFITFKKFIISNKILGYNDLKIKADDKKNSITVKHLLAVIRELARRASKGDIEIEYQ